MKLFRVFASICFSLLVVLVTSGSLYAQVIKTGISFGYKQSTFTVINDESGHLHAGNAYTSTYGLSVYLLRDLWSFETGFYSVEMPNAFYFESNNGISSKEQSFSSISTFRVPVIFSREFPLTEWFSFAPSIGFSWLTNDASGPAVSTTELKTVSFQSSGTDVVQYEYFSRIPNESKFLGEVGVDLNFQLTWIFLLKLETHYSFGLRPVEETEINYRINGGELHTGTLVSRGSGWNFGVGIVIPIYN